MSPALAVLVAVAVAVVAAACSSSTSGPSSGGSGASGSTTPGAGSVVATPVAENWTTHGFDLGSTRATRTETSISPANVAGLTQAWATPNLRGVSANPLYLDGSLYFGDWTGSVRALDATTGQQRWAVDLQNPYIGGSLATAGNRLFVGEFNAKVTALDKATGATLWSTPVGDGAGSAVFGAPIVVDGLVVVGVASFQEFTSPTGATFRGHVVALDAATGAEVWRFWTTNNDTASGPGVAVWSALSADADRHLVFVPTGNNYEPPSGPYADAVLALDSRNGALVWARRFTEGDVWTLGGAGTGPDADVGAPPTLVDAGGRPAIAVGDKGGTFWALDRLTGEVLWKHQLTKGGAQGGVMASAAAHDDRVFVLSNKADQPGQHADLVALAVGDGHELWRVGVGGHGTGPVTWSNGVVYVTDDAGEVTGYAAADGAQLWQVTVPAPSASGVTVAAGTVFAGFGWWLAAPPPDPQGGLIAYRLPGAAGTTAGTPAGSTPSAGSVVKPLGQTVYERSCGSCHGGDGSGGFGPSLLGVSERLSPEAHLAVVRNGRNARMPAWSGVLSDDEITAVVEYERSTFR